MGDDKVAASDSLCSLNGKVAIVTGASSGIGASIAVVLARFGARLAITGRSAENLEAVAKECFELPGAIKPLIIVADLRKDDDIKRIIDTTVQTYGKLDILVNNAGIFELGDVDTTSMEQFDRIFQTNVRPVYQLSVLAAPHLTKTKGNIVNVSSTYGTITVPTALAYSMSKSALNQFTKCLSLGLAPKGVRVNSVSPGFIATDIFRRAGIDAAGCKQILHRATEIHPLRRLGECEDVAKAIVFLASDAASFTTGEDLHVDGGLQRAYIQ